TTEGKFLPFQFRKQDWEEYQIKAGRLKTESAAFAGNRVQGTETNCSFVQASPWQDYPNGL
ncbi:hypothetical protein ACQP3C_26920, partial [Escherichia coli]